MTLKNLLLNGKRTFLKKSALALFSGLIFTSAVAQTTVQIGTSTNTNSNIPLTTNYGYNYAQFIYTAADLNAVGVTGPATISKISFYLNSGSTSSSFQWKAFLGNSTKTNFNSTTDWEVIGNLTQCFDGIVTFPSSSGGWLTITLSTPFAWDGTSNLVIGIDENEPSFGTLLSWRVSPLGSNRSIYYRNDATNPDPATPPTATGRVGSVPNVQLEVMPTNACSGLPASATILSNQSNTLCENQSFVLSLDNAFYENGITYQWQSFDGTTWNDIVDDTLSTSSNTADPAISQYQVIVGCDFSGMETIMSPYTLTVNGLPIVQTDIDSVSFCEGGAAVITASGAITYSWSPATGLNNTNQAIVNANPTTGITYTVTGTDVNGCVNTATSYIVPASLAPTTIVVDPSENCTFGNTVSGTVLGVPNDSEGGAWSYRFLNADGLTEAQPWNSSNVFNFIPTADSVYSFYYQVKNASCATANDSVKFDFVVGFGGDVSIIDYDCNNLGGTISVENAFGQLETATIYQNTFAVSTPDVALSGAALFTGGRLVLTPSQVSSSGEGSFNTTVTQLGPNNSMNVSFLMTMDQPINVGADGMAYSFGNDVLTSPGAPNTLQNGRGSKLRLSFDAIDNSMSNGNITGVYLVYGWTSGTEYGPNSNGVIAFTPSTGAWFNKTDVLVELSISPSGKATVIVDGQILFDNIQMPATYMNADATTWKHHFGARTGGYAFRHAVSNFEISTGTLAFGLSQGSVSTAPTIWQQDATFTDLAPGTYNVWLSKDGSTACAKNIEVVEILNTNPIVDLGNDTTICSGSTLVLDAGNTGSTYVWSGSQVTTQTNTVNQAGAYVVNVTQANGCVGIGSVVVGVQSAPTATSIFSQGSYPNYSFSVIGANNADTYDWNFGDGTTLMNGPSSITHTYSTSGIMNVVATLSNGCGSTDVSAQVNVINDLSLNELDIAGLSVYPNPANSNITISLEDLSESSVSIFSITGSVVVESLKFIEMTTIDVSNWERGVYFLQVSNNGMFTTKKVVVE